MSYHDDRKRQRPNNEGGHRPPKDAPPVGVIHVISVGIEKNNGGHPQKRSRVSRLVLKLDYSNPHHEQWVEPIMFTNKELQDVNLQYNDPMVITAWIADFFSGKDLGGSRFVCRHAVLKLSTTSLESHDQNLTGFTGDQITPLRKISLLMTLGEGTKTKSIIVSFLVVGTPSTYNALLGRPSLNVARAVISIAHLKMKFPTPEGVGLVKANQKVSRQCYALRLGAVRKPLPKEEEKGRPAAEILNCEVEDFRNECKGQPRWGTWKP